MTSNNKFKLFWLLVTYKIMPMQKLIHSSIKDLNKLSSNGYPLHMYIVKHGRVVNSIISTLRNPGNYYAKNLN